MDEVYRAMFRLEAGRSGAELGLALALLRACAAAEELPQRAEVWKWLRQICPICLAMIEKSPGAERSEDLAGFPSLRGAAADGQKRRATR